MSAPEHDWPEWMHLGKAKCGWSNMAADEGNQQRYVRADIVQELAEALEVIAGSADDEDGWTSDGHERCTDIARATLAKLQEIT